MIDHENNHKMMLLRQQYAMSQAHLSQPWILPRAQNTTALNIPPSDDSEKLLLLEDYE